jgi:putative membrane protein
VTARLACTSIPPLAASIGANLAGSIGARPYRSPRGTSSSSLVGTLRLISLGQRRNLVGALSGLACFIASQAAWAHVGDAYYDAEAWDIWSFTPDIVIPALLVCLVYLAGSIRRRAFEDSTQLWRHAAFLAGVLAIFFALASPIDYMAGHAFFMHQIQYLLLYMVGPMLIMLASPQAMLMSGLPISRRKAEAPTKSNSVTRRRLAWPTSPVVVTALYIAALYVWQYPPYHDAALLSMSFRYLMYASMLGAGLLFWWRVFDMRPAPAGPTYGTRLMMLWIMIVFILILGSFTTIKSQVLYPIYDTVGRLFVLPPVLDEMLGGIVILILSSMMCLVGVLIVIHMWGRGGRALGGKGMSSLGSGASMPNRPTTGDELLKQARTKNHVLVVGCAAFAIVLFATVLSIGVLNHLNGANPHGLFASRPGSSKTSVQ